MDSEAEFQNSWFPSYYFDPAAWKGAGLKVCVILLNSSLKGFEEQFNNLWKNAFYRVAVDGGCNELVRLDQECLLDLKSHMPTFISGDFDSITSASKEHLDNLKCKSVPTPDQNLTDFTKSLKLLEIMFQTMTKADLILPVVKHEGRYDHIFSNVNTLFKATKFCLPKIVVYSFNSLSWLLLPGRHEIYVDKHNNHGHCGLIPIGHSCRDCYTQGLRWNLKHQKMEFGELISTCNTYEEHCEVVTVVNSDILLWIMEV